MARLALPLAVLALTSCAATQIPEGSYVTSHFKVGTFIGPAGLFSIARNGTTAPITGIPPEVAGAGATVAGPDFVVHRDDGVLITNGAAIQNTQLPVLFLTLQGLSVVSTLRYDVGRVTGAGSRGCPQAHVLASGAVAVAVDDVTVGAAGEPLAGALVGIVDPGVGPPGTPGAVSPVPIAPRPPGDINAFAVDEAAGVAYLGMISTGGPSEVWQVPFPAGGTPTSVATMSETITGLAIDNSGAVLATASGSGGLHRIVPGTGAVTRLVPTLNNLNGVAVQRATGERLVVTGAPGSRLLRIGSKGSMQTLSSGPAGGWGTADGVAVAQTPVPYGAATPRQNSYTWQLAPNPGGLPTAGNSNFSMTVNATPGAPAASALVLTTAPLSQPFFVFGVQLWVEASAGLVAVIPAPGATRTTFPLPIPRGRSGRGFQLFMQSVHVEAGGAFGATRAVRLTVL